MSSECLVKNILIPNIFKLAFTGTCICIFEITLYFTYTCKFTLARAFLDFSQIFIINIDIHICHSISYYSFSLINSG